MVLNIKLVIFNFLKLDLQAGTNKDSFYQMENGCVVKILSIKIGNKKKSCLMIVSLIA
jgi:hypothetical protein